MLKKIQIGLLAVWACVGMAQADDTLIYFRIVDGFEIVNADETRTTWDSSYRSAEGYAIDSARVAVTGGGLTDATPLILGYINGNTFVSGAEEIALDETPPPQTMYAFITDYASAEYSFTIELGSYDSGEWTTLATSASLTYQQLQTGDGVNGSYITTYDATLPTPQGIWAPQSYDVPEPSSGLMLLIGAGLLALRRGRARSPSAPCGGLGEAALPVACGGRGATALPGRRG